MPGKHSAMNHQIAVKLNHELFRKIELKSEEHKMTPGQFIRWVLEEELSNVELSQEDLEEVCRRVLANKTKRK